MALKERAEKQEHDIRCRYILSPSSPSFSVELAENRVKGYLEYYTGQRIRKVHTSKKEERHVRWFLFRSMVHSR